MIKENIRKARERIFLICSKLNRDPSTVNLVAVTKGRLPEEIQEAIACGITDIAENKVQEALLKYRDVRSTMYEVRTTTDERVRSEAEPPRRGRPTLHMVGHLQANKAGDAVKIFDLIQSVDSLRLAREIDKQAAKINKVQDVLVEVKTSPEAAKFGIKPEEAAEVIKEIAKLKNIRVKGLMTIAAMVVNPQDSRAYFRRLRELRDNLYQLPVTNYQLPILSMGMSDDFEAAIEEGSTMVRLGRAIFEG